MGLFPVKITTNANSKTHHFLGCCSGWVVNFYSHVCKEMETVPMDLYVCLSVPGIKAGLPLFKELLFHLDGFFI